jgi:hypothetical protein
MEVTPLPKPLPAQEQRSNNIVTALLQAPGTAAAAGDRKRRHASPRAGSTSGTGLRGPDRRGERCECSRSLARPRETCTLQDLGLRLALSAVPVGQRYRGVSCATEGGTGRQGISSDTDGEVALPAHWARGHSRAQVSEIGLPSRNLAAGLPMARSSGEKQGSRGPAPVRAAGALLAWLAPRASAGRGAKTGTIPLFS